jgi:hypothetical protein
LTTLIIYFRPLGDVNHNENCENRRPESIFFSDNRSLDIPKTSGERPLLESTDGPNPPGEVLIVVMPPAAVVGEVQVTRHVRSDLRQRPIIEIISNTTISKITNPGDFQVEIYLS